jgi:hypothetical protein
VYALTFFLQTNSSEFKSLPELLMIDAYKAIASKTVANASMLFIFVVFLLLYT